MLTPLQRRVARLVAELPEAASFALAGGAALVVHRLSERATNDLDFFTSVPADVPDLHAALGLALVAAGLDLQVDQASDSFVRLVVSDGHATTLVDLAWDVRLRPVVSSPLGRVLDPHELAADKLLALFGRAEPRDFVDVYRLSQRFLLRRLFDLAVQKDTGFTPSFFARSLRRFDQLDRDVFDVDDDEYQALRAWVSDTRHRLAREPPGLGR